MNIVDKATWRLLLELGNMNENSKSHYQYIKDFIEIENKLLFSFDFTSMGTRWNNLFYNYTMEDKLKVINYLFHSIDLKYDTSNIGIYKCDFSRTQSVNHTEADHKPLKYTNQIFLYKKDKLENVVQFLKNININYSIAELLNIMCSLIKNEDSFDSLLVKILFDNIDINTVEIQKIEHLYNKKLIKPLIMPGGMLTKKSKKKKSKKKKSKKKKSKKKKYLKIKFFT